MDSVEPAQPDSEFLSSRTCHRLTLAILLVGVLWRVVRYFLQFPMWGDEGMLAVNFYYLDYAEMTRRLENYQIAPLLFLWGERTALLLLGSGVLAMRLLPLLAGLSALALYWHLTGLLLKPRARLFAFAFLAVGIWPVSMCTLIKPYSLDLCMTLLLLVLATRWLREPGHSRWLIGLTLAAPFALLGSYPTAFVAGGISLTLLLPAWHAGWRARTWFAAYNVAVLTGFLLAMYVGNNQMNTRQGGTTATAMTTYWAEGFPPSNPLMVLPWFLLSVTGQMCAYPLGASYGGSTLTFLCCVVGAWGWYRGGQKTWLLLLLSPLVLNLFASVLHRYPFGTSCRLNQHLAPTMCLLAGLGLAAILEGPTWATSRRLRVNLLVASLFLLVGLGGLTRDLAQPYRRERYTWYRDTMSEMRQIVPVEAPLIVYRSHSYHNCIFEWYWMNEREDLTWNCAMPARLPFIEEVWCFHFGPDADCDLERVQKELSQRSSGWMLSKRIPYEYFPKDRKDEHLQCELFQFTRSPRYSARGITPPSP